MSRSISPLTPSGAHGLPQDLERSDDHWFVLYIPARPSRRMVVGTETRLCVQCGALFTPLREHARFCSAACRVGWNRTTTGDPVVAFRALQWSVPAIRDATRRLELPSHADQRAALAAISDAVWAVTMVDAAMVRYHPEVYERVLSGESTSDRRLIEKGLAGLRFVRKQAFDDARLADFVEPAGSECAPGQVGVQRWIWKRVKRLQGAGPGRRALAWETARYLGYRDQLAGRPVTEVFEQAEAFLHRAAAEAKLTTDVGA